MKRSVSKLVKNQKITKLRVIGKEKLKVTIRYDDQCGNGHNSFGVTCSIYEQRGVSWSEYGGGADHESIVKFFPDLEPYIKWHFMSSDGPLHYLANTMYHASDKDCNGLRKGGFRSFTYNVTVAGSCVFTSMIFYSFRNWLHRDEAKAEADKFLALIKPELKPEIVKVGSGAASDGKEIDLEAARSCAIWPEATLKQLQDKEALNARLPGLIEEFKDAVESLGMVF